MRGVDLKTRIFTGNFIDVFKIFKPFDYMYIFIRSQSKLYEEPGGYAADKNGVMIGLIFIHRNIQSVANKKAKT